MSDTESNKQAGKRRDRRLVRRCIWTVRNIRTGMETTYHGPMGIPVNMSTVETSPKVLLWAHGDPIEVFPPNAKHETRDE